MSFFQGELMTCSKCGVTQQSDPIIESGWICLIDMKTMTSKYICPKCWGIPYVQCSNCKIFLHIDYYLFDGITECFKCGGELKVCPGDSKKLHENLRKALKKHEGGEN